VGALAMETSDMDVDVEKRKALWSLDNLCSHAFVLIERPSMPFYFSSN
jgi:hypothetical protein